jgi:uncharacterized protein (TIGR03437 family)
VFSDLLGGSAASSARAVAVNASGQVLVSGISTSSAFPATPGAYSIANTANHPYLLELDPAGATVVFSATGIGGSALAADAAGNIYMAGTTALLDYPTTPGAYQAAFPVFSVCAVPCFTPYQGVNQYVTKTDPTGATLIWSTAVSGTGNTTNNGLAVDAQGSVYLTGLAGAGYPYTVATPALTPGAPGQIPALPFLSKLDPSGETLLFSVPVGGAGVQADSGGNVYAGGGAGNGPIPGSGYVVTAALPALASVPAACLPNGLTILNSAYVAQVDAASGSVRGAQFIGGSTLTASAVALSGSVLWIAGAASLADFPFTPGALTLPDFGPGPLPGAYLGAVDFSQPEPPAGTPRIGCIANSADIMAAAGPAARYELLTILGTGLGPAAGVSAPDNSTTTLGGVNVTFDSLPAPLLYASSTQINLAVPLVPSGQPFSTLRLTVNGAAAPARLIPLTYANAALFLNTQDNFFPLGSGPRLVAVALNADGSVNSASHPAALGSSVSVFVNGLTPDPQVTTAPIELYADLGWTVTNIVQATPFVLRVDMQVPAALVDDFSCGTVSVCAAAFDLYDVSLGSVTQAIGSGGASFGGVVYIQR